MTVSNDPDEIRADIERTRAELSDNVDALADTANPKNIARRQAGRVKGAARGAKEYIMGSPDDPDDSGRVGDARYAVQDKAAAVTDKASEAKYALQEKASDAKYAVQDKASAVGDAVSSAPAQVKQRARGNPLAAGLIAFGAGLLVSGLIPSSEKEQQAASRLQEKAEPLKEKATEAAREVAENLREPAQEAVQSVKETATEGVQAVKEEGASAKQDVQDQLQDSKETVKQETQSG
jgi:gas vesicle protein